jgi:hypothetical protein
MECPIGMAVYHINGDRLDNRRCNLLVQKRHLRPNKMSARRSTPYKGVQSARGRYRVKIRKNGIQETIAYCDTALEGALIYDDAARSVYGDLARLNFPERKHGQVMLANKGIRNGLNGAAKKRKVVPNFDGKGNTKIELRHGVFAVIDDDVWTLKKRHYWTNGNYVEISPCDVTWIAHRSKNHKRYVISSVGRIHLHRLITECPPGLIVDHIDGNPLNNTRANLRICTNAENLKNGRKRKPTKHKFKGVVRLGSAKYVKPRYSFTIASNNMLYRGRSHKTKLEAALAYDDMAIKLHGEFACLNFPERYRAKMAVAN